MHIYYIIVCLCQLLQTFSVDAMFSRAGSMRKQPLSQARVISPTIRPSLWSRIKTSVNSYFTQKSSLHTSAPVYQEKGSQQQAAPRSDDIKNKSYDVPKSAGFFQRMLDNYRLNQYLKKYDTDTMKILRITEIIESDHGKNPTDAERDEIYNLFSHIQDPSIKVVAFFHLARANVGENDERFSELYKEVKPDITRAAEKSGNTELQIIQTVRSILNSFYKNKSVAIDYAYEMYAKLSYKAQKNHFSDIIVLDGIKNEKFHNLYKQLYKEPSLEMIVAIKMYDAKNKEAVDYANSMVEKLKSKRKEEYKLSPNADNIQIIFEMLDRHTSVNQTPPITIVLAPFSIKEQLITILLLQEAFEKFKREGIDPRIWYKRDWNFLYAKFEKIETIKKDFDNPLWVKRPFSTDNLLSSDNPPLALFKKYGFEPFPDSSQQSDQKKQSDLGQNPGFEYNPQWAYKTLGLPYNMPFIEAKRRWDRLTETYNSGRGIDHSTLLNLNKALNIIEKHTKIPEDL